MIPKVAEPNLERIARRVWDNLVAASYRGSDPYDGLNSRLLGPVLSRSRLLRLAVIQGVKRSPVDLRPLLRIPPGLNPKGLALVLQGAAEWPQLGDTRDQQAWLGDALVCLASGMDGTPAGASRQVTAGAAEHLESGELAWPLAAGWGYDFPWQSKAFLQPAYLPTVVATSFALDALELAQSPALGKVSGAAGHFVADHLHRHQDDDGICFSYSPGDHTRVYNASLFGARILAQTANHVPDMAPQWRTLARSAVDWVMAKQATDGSWVYGDADHWRWIDNLHTGFNLETINRVAGLLETDAWDEGIARGLDFYRKALFASGGTPSYYTTSAYPLDPHSYAQGALTFLRLKHFQPDGVEFAGRILTHGVHELWDEKKGGFRFQKHRWYAQKSIHMRWSQAWMFRAICAWLSYRDGKS